MIRLHPLDLRAIMAACVHGGTAGLVQGAQMQFWNTPSESIEETDRLLAQLVRSAPKAETHESMDAEWLADKIGALGDYGQGAALKLRELAARAENQNACIAATLEENKTLKARISEATSASIPDGFEHTTPCSAWVAELYTRMDEELAEANELLGKAREEVERITGLQAQSFRIAVEAQERLRQIDAAKEGEQPIPGLGVGCPEPYRADALAIAAWGRQGWDAAAALRVNSNAAKEGKAASLVLLEMHLTTHQGELDQARAEGEMAERERIIELLTHDLTVPLCVCDFDRHADEMVGEMMDSKAIRAALTPNDRSRS